MLPNCPQLVISFFAALEVGAIVVMCNPLYTVRELDLQLRDAKAPMLITLDLFWPKARELKAREVIRQVVLTTLGPYLNGFKKIIYPLLRRFKGKINFKHGQGAYFFDSLLNEAQEAETQEAAAPDAGSPGTGFENVNRLDDLAAIQYTAGTTGESQGVMLSHRNLIVNAFQVARWLPSVDVGNERMLAVLPFSIFSASPFA